MTLFSKTVIPAKVGIPCPLPFAVELVCRALFLSSEKIRNGQRRAQSRKTGASGTENVIPAFAGRADFFLGRGVRKIREKRTRFSRGRRFQNPRAGEDAPATPDGSTVIAPGTELATKDKPKAKRPSLYKVYILNDDYTPMEFVVSVLETFFNKSREDATRIMMHVHRKGAGLCGVYPFDVAETKVAQVMMAARQAQHPLQATMERE
jgi:ATP-dependent Clp protease adaptor protein ClpS